MKKFSKVTMLLALALTLALIASCEDKDDDDPCNCLATYGTTAHLGIGETCACGGKPCNCTEEKNTTAIPGITIRRDKTITSAQMTAKISGDIATALNGLTAGEKVTLVERVTEIHIVPGNNYTSEGTIMKIGIDVAADMIEYRFSIIVAQAPQKPTYYMAQSKLSVGQHV